MKDLNPPSDQPGTPEDVATLYSWANLHGAKYRDFSAARAQTREKVRLRTEQSIEEQQRRAHESAAPPDEPLDEDVRTAEEAEAWAELAAAEEQAGRESARLAAERLEAEQAAKAAEEVAAQQAAEIAAQQARERAAQLAAERAAHIEAERAAAEAARQAAQQVAQQRAWAPSVPPFFAAPPAAPYYPPRPQGYNAAYGPSHANRPVAPTPIFYPSLGSHPFAAPVQQESQMPRNPWTANEQREPSERPAWLNTEVEPPAPVVAAPPPAPDDTLQGSRDRLASRWFALRGVFDGNPPLPEAVPVAAASRAPALAVFSLAGGVGKTSLVANLGRALSERGERVLLVDTAAFGLLPFFFGATDQRPGVLRTFSPPGASTDAPIQMVTIDPDGINSELPGPESLSGEISKFARGASRIIVDLATASGATTCRILRMSPLVLVPVIADMNSVVSVGSIDAFFEHNSNPGGKPTLPFYMINQFDASMPLHLDVREVLRKQLGDRLLPFALRRAPAMSEALAEGMTVMDYAPNSPLAEDFATLAGWVKSLSAPATTSYRGVRWSER